MAAGDAPHMRQLCETGVERKYCKSGASPVQGQGVFATGFVVLLSHMSAQVVAS